MTTHPTTVLAIDPGSHELGAAVLRGRELLFYRVKTVTDRKNPIKVLEVVTSYIRNLVKKYRPELLAIEKLFVTQKNSALLVIVTEQIKVTAKEANLVVWEYAPQAVRKRLCQSGRATKREAAHAVSLRYPELERFYRKTKAWERDYYASMFDAVAVGVICAEDLTQNAAQNKP